MKEIFEKIGLDVEYRAKKLKQGIDISLPDIDDLSTEDALAALKLIDVRAAVACIAEANKMEGVYAAEKHAHLISEDKENKVADLISEYEKDY